MFGTGGLAFLLALLASSSLLMGAALGLAFRWPPRLVAGITAFGSGALIATLAFDLVAEGYERVGIAPVAVGFLLGAALFVLANEAINTRGGFLRKPATLARFVHRLRHGRAMELLERLSTVDLVRALPPEDAHALALMLEGRSYRAGQTIVPNRENDALYIVGSGRVELTAGKTTQTFGPGQAFGERALLLGEPFRQAVRAQSDTHVWLLRRERLELLEERSPPVAKAVESLRSSYRAGLATADHSPLPPAAQWHSAARHHLERHRTGALSITRGELHAEVAERAKGGAVLAVFLGALLDGIPESVVIGTSLLLEAAFSPLFVAAIFMANFPEGLSSSVQMREHGYTVRRVLLLWGGLVLSSGIAALLGNVLLGGAPLWFLAGAEALAAGAILAMLADTMMPEAFEQGGPSIALWTALGFLAPLVVRSLLHVG